MNIVEVTLGSLVDRALLELRSPAEIGYVFTPSAGSFGSAGTTTFTPPDVTKISTSDVIEVDDELMLVGQVNTSTGVVTVQRGYYGTTAAAHDDVPATINPQWPRIRVAEGVRRSFARLEAFGLPLVKSDLLTSTPSETDECRLVLEIPAEARDVRSVMYDLDDLAGWRFLPQVPTDAYPTGKIVRLPRGIDPDWYLNVTYTVPYRWSTFPDDPVADSTVELLEGAEELPAQYGAAWVISSREVSRSDIDRSEEWNQTEPLRNGVSTAFLRAKWQEFYRALDEAVRLQPAPTHQHVRTRRRRWMG